MRTIVSLALLGLLSTGCSAFTSPARRHELSPTKNYWFDYDASRRGTVLVGADGKFQKSCAEPAPDIAYTVAANVEAQVKARDDIDGQVKGNLAMGVLEIAKKNQMVLFFREALYRLCEISLNNQVADATILALYRQIIETALRLGEPEQIRNDRIALEAELAARKQAVAAADARAAEAEAAIKKAANEAEKQQLRDEIERQKKIRDAAFARAQELQNAYFVVVGALADQKKKEASTAPRTDTPTQGADKSNSGQTNPADNREQAPEKETKAPDADSKPANGQRNPADNREQTPEKETKTTDTKTKQPASRGG